MLKFLIIKFREVNHSNTMLSGTDALGTMKTLESYEERECIPLVNA
jgi:hypothetical protein